MLQLRVYPGSASSKEHACQCRRRKRCGFDPWVRKTSWRRARQPSPVFLPGESHGQRSLAGYSPWGRKESDTTEVTEHLDTQEHQCAQGMNAVWPQGTNKMNERKEMVIRINREGLSNDIGSIFKCIPVPRMLHMYFEITFADEHLVLLWASPQ